MSGAFAMTLMRSDPFSMTRRTDIPSSPWLDWQGLGGWNIYFLFKLALLWAGYLNFHPLPNLVFACVLLLPLRRPGLRRVRHWLAIPAGMALLYHDTWLPGIDSIMSQGSQIFSFTLDYWFDLLSRFINWEMVGATFVMTCLYLFLAQWLRFTPWIVIALLWLWLVPILGNPFHGLLSAATALSSGIQAERQAPAAVEDEALTLQLEQSAPPTNENLTTYLDDFYNEERGRRVIFPSELPVQATPFDVLIINICSLAWSDVEASGLTEHPVWRHFDLRFTRFNSATSYSGPASIRLLRASCGQPSHEGLYAVAPRQCLLMENLAALGFEKQVAMDHSGTFGNYLKDLNANAGLDMALMNQQGLPHDIASFDGEPIFRGDALFARWVEQRAQSDAARNTTFFNLIALHDGNRFAASKQIAPFKPRLKTLLDQLDHFMSELESSGRKVAVILVPEHGAALSGDRMQMSGLRDIPSPSITQVPVGVALLGTKAKHEQTRIIDAPSSYLAISELVSRLVKGDLFGSETIDWPRLLQGLPQTQAVSENSGSVVIEYQDKYHILLGKGDWVPYPQ